MVDQALSKMQGQTHKASAGMDTFTQTQKLRQAVEGLKSSRFSTWDDYEGFSIVFEDPAERGAYLLGVKLGRETGMGPQDCFELRATIHYNLDQALGELAHSGRTDLGAVGLMLGAEDKAPGMDVMEFGQTPRSMTMFINRRHFPGFGGYDIVVLGPRGVGKSNTLLNYISLPWMATYDCPVLSMVPIHNADDFNSSQELYQSFEFKTRALRAACKIRMSDIDNQTKTRILSPNDESGVLAGRTKTSTNMVHNQTIFCYISRHFRLASLWTYQIGRDIPYKILELAKEHVYVDSHEASRRVLFTHDRGELVQKFYGFKGCEQLKKLGPGNYIEYDVDTPSTAIWDVDVLELLVFVNSNLSLLRSKDKNREMQFFKAVDSYLASKEEDGAAGASAASKKHFIKSALITLGLINEKLFIGNDGMLYVNEGNMSAKFRQVSGDGLKLNMSYFGYLLEPLGVTPLALSKLMTRLYEEIRKNPGMFSGTSTLTEEEEGAIDAAAEEIGIRDVLDEDVEA